MSAAKARHVCPRWCHDCPDIVDGFMPYCAGGSINGRDSCHCDEGPSPFGGRGKPTVRVALTRRQWSALEQRADAEGVDVPTLTAKLLAQVVTPPRRKPELKIADRPFSASRTPEGTTDGG